MNAIADSVTHRFSLAHAAMRLKTKLPIINPDRLVSFSKVSLKQLLLLTVLIGMPSLTQTSSISWTSISTISAVWCGVGANLNFSWPIGTVG